MAGNPEAVLLAEIRLALGKRTDNVCWRNAAGQFMADFGAKGMRPVKTGLTVGASDLIGIVKPSGRMLAIEAKSDVGRERPEQKLFRRLVNAMGGYACVVRSVEDAIEAVNAAARGDAAPEVK